jgi:hypothetical protein
LWYLGASVLVLGIVVLFVTFVPNRLGPWSGPFGPIEAVVIALLMAALAVIMNYSAKKLRAIALIYEDLAREFRT